MASPANYLVQILIELKAKQIVKSLRGKEGGYLLARPPCPDHAGRSAAMYPRSRVRFARFERPRNARRN
jgi:hypothetical protein